MATSSTSDAHMFSVQFDGRIALTEEQIGAIEDAIGAAVAEKLVMLSIPATSQPLLKPESVPIDGTLKILGRWFVRPDL